MGAFLLVKKENGLGGDEVERLYRKSLSVFDGKGLSLNKRIVNSDYVLWVYNKYRFPVDNVVQYDSGEFVVSTGTLIYNKKIGRKALEELYHDFSENGEFLSKASGQYSLVLSRNGKLYILNDYTGLYHIYCNSDKSVISSSFLAVMKTLTERAISTQELYEYIISGASFGGKTLLKGIELLDSKFILQLSPELAAVKKPPPEPLSARNLDSRSPLDEIVKAFVSDLSDYFGTIQANFGNSICSGLSGGVHTRLMLALMKKAGTRPDYLYVFGDISNTAGRDAYAVQIAQSIAKGEGLPIEHIDRDKYPKFAKDEHEELLRQRYYLGDGLGHENGLFDNGSDLDIRLRRTEKTRLQLNGGGGETFRNYWNLPDRSLNIRSFLKSSHFDNVGYSIFSGRFDQNAYFSALQAKIKSSLEIDGDKINRRQIELIQPEFENKYWMGNNNSLNNLLAYSLTPFGDTPLVYQACNVPIRFKNLSIFEAALVKAIDPDLAKHPTSQGYDLFYHKIGLRKRMEYNVRLNMPFGLRAYLRKHFYSGAGERLRLKGNKFDLPYYFGKEYLAGIFKSDELALSEYVHLDEIANPSILSRVLTAELVVNDRF